MFKSILPSKRISSSDFTMVTVVDGINPDQAFDRLLDDLQIPSTLRPKLVNMDSTVKAAMIKSSQIPQFKQPVTPPRSLRRAHSSDSLQRSPEFEFPHLTQTSGFTQYPSKSVVTLGLHARGSSLHVDTLGRGQVPPVIPNELHRKKGAARSITPFKFCSILTGISSTQLDVEHVKKLRLLLRNESASWSQEFLRLGGYAALLTRLNEILEVEWREEQHDDQILHELLRCFKALSTSSIGCFALRSSCPVPFVQLVSLLYSDKKPGDVGTRQLIVELLLILFELYPPSSLSGSTRRSRHDPADSTASSCQPFSLPAPHKTFFELIRALLLTPAPPPSESPAAPVSPHAFIESLHRPRIYKTYLQELSDICRDYFWVFCHPNNTIWTLADTDEGKVEKPRAPGGMTGGVEFEAMGYLTLHLKLLNAVAQAVEDLKLPKEDELSAHRFHSDLFLSGLERIILIARKASTTYYPTMHLELARYVAFAGRARFELPWTVSRLIGPPPTALCKMGRSTRAQSVTELLGSPSKRATGGPVLPSPQIEPLRFN